MEIYGAFKFKPFGKEELVGLAKTQKKAISLLRREFPNMRGKLEDRTLTSDINNTYLLTIKGLEVEE